MLDVYVSRVVQSWRSLRFRWFRFRNVPVISVAYFGWLTGRPQVVVSASGRYPQGWGSQTVYAYLVHENGDACATMHGESLAQIIGARYVDERTDWQRAEIESIRRKSNR